MESSRSEKLAKRIEKAKYQFLKIKGMRTCTVYSKQELRSDNKP
jgi:hypothetical protein